MLAEERARLHVLPDEPYAAALGELRLVGADQTVRLGSVRYSTPPGHVGRQVWCRVHGEQLVIAYRPGAARGRPACAVHPWQPAHLRRALSGLPREGDGPRPPRPRPSTLAEGAFLELGEGAHAWLVEAGAHGAQRVRTRMSEAVELAALLGGDLVDRALGVAAAAGRFGEGDLASIAEHLARGGADAAAVAIDEAHTTQPSTDALGGFGR